MKIYITDYPGVLNRDTDYEKNRILSALKDAEDGNSVMTNTEVDVISYTDREEWLKKVADADALLTAFIPIDADIINKIPNLKCIVQNASGYENIDLETATERGIAVIPIEEYCTLEVAEHTFALILALARGLKHYGQDIDNNHKWQYSSITNLHRLAGMKIGIAGYGKIGKQVGKLATAFGMEVLVYSPTGKNINTPDSPVNFVTKEQLFQESDVITNHMAVGKDHYKFFNYEAFKAMEKHPIFINVGRGVAVDETALIRALDEGLLSAAGLDVLESENPDLSTNPLVARENVIITPHSAFYSEESLKALQDISCDNLTYYLKGETEKVHRIVNDV